MHDQYRGGHDEALVVDISIGGVSILAYQEDGGLAAARPIMAAGLRCPAQANSR